MHTGNYRPEGGRTAARFAPRTGAPSRFARGNGDRPQGGRGGASFNNRRPNNGPRKQRGMGEYIDARRFVSKAEALPPEAPFVPRFAFNELPIAEDLKRAIAARGYATPTPIQDGAIPEVLKGRDVLGTANTGTGKTAAFLIPLIEKVRRVRGEMVLVVVPTRELAIQIEDELRALTKGMRIYSVCAVGGVSIQPQLRGLRSRNEFVIGTPGRLKDLVERRALKLEDFRTIVLDEADRMLDMGFIDDMRYLMERMPTPRHTLFFSATISPTIAKLVQSFLTNPVQVAVKTRDTSRNVDQDIVRIAPGQDKSDVLHQLLQDRAFEKVLVFGRTKHGVEKLAERLSKQGVRAQSIHGNKNHNARQRALADFRTGRAQVLIATDVAARGLDIAAVSHVINFDTPSTYDDYVHRIGRTGRANKTGKALTFVEGRY